MTIYRLLNLRIGLSQSCTAQHCDELSMKGGESDDTDDVVDHWSAGDRCGVPHVWGACP
jgi:hypothetical protein